MPRITEMFCFAVSDKDDDDEGIPAMDTRLGPMPLIGADVTRIDSLLPYAQKCADEIGKPLRIYKFSQREQIGEVTPRRLPLTDAPIVHALQYGFALCRFGDTVPGNWPDGHRWVGLDEMENVTCPDCLEVTNALPNG